MALNSLKSKVKYRISRNPVVVFVPADFSDLSDRDQVGRALRELVREEILIKFGRGLYAKAKRSSLSNKLVPVKPLPDLAREALTQKLGVEVVSSREQASYNSGKSTQVPTGRLIAVRGRVSPEDGLRWQVNQVSVCLLILKLLRKSRQRWVSVRPLSKRTGTPCRRLRRLPLMRVMDFEQFFLVERVSQRPMG